MPVRIRRADAGDAATLHELAAATFGLACPPGTTQSSIDDFVASTLSEAKFDSYLADRHRALFLAEVDGAAAGYTIMIRPGFSSVF